MFLKRFCVSVVSGAVGFLCYVFSDLPDSQSKDGRYIHIPFPRSKNVSVFALRSRFASHLFHNEREESSWMSRTALSVVSVCVFCFGC